ncbi:MAG: 30S ribosomal protein S20 [Blastopirellula sp.]|nr:MAG: 30S ribosomal protein S20 [Blastopirellula sp.]
MPNRSSSEKRLRQNVVRKARNKSIKTAVRSLIRKTREAVAAGEFDTAQSQFLLASRKIDKAGAKNIFHKNTVDRMKSRLSHHIKTAKQAAS